MSDLLRKVDELKGEWAASQALEQRKAAMITVRGLTLCNMRAPDARFRLKYSI